MGLTEIAMPDKPNVGPSTLLAPWLLGNNFQRMVTVAKKSAKKAASPASKSLVGVRTKSGLVFGYGRDLVKVRPGVDLTKPTYVLGK